MQDRRVRSNFKCSRVGIDIIPSFAAYSVAFSPFFPDKLAVAGAANFGLVGNGRLSLIDLGGGLNSPAPMGIEKV